LDGLRYGHILNPKIGWPAPQLASVSVARDLCLIAGSAATIAILKEAAGPAGGHGPAPFLVDVYGETGGSLGAPANREGIRRLAEPRARCAGLCGARRALDLPPLSSAASKRSDEDIKAAVDSG
jgi:hypothetical protein